MEPPFHKQCMFRMPMCKIIHTSYNVNNNNIHLIIHDALNVTLTFAISFDRLWCCKITGSQM